MRRQHRGRRCEHIRPRTAPRTYCPRCALDDELFALFGTDQIGAGLRPLIEYWHTRPARSRVYVRGLTGELREWLRNMAARNALSAAATSLLMLRNKGQYLYALLTSLRSVVPPSVDIIAFEHWLEQQFLKTETPEVANLLRRYWKLALCKRMLARHPAQSTDALGCAPAKKDLYRARNLLRVVCARETLERAIGQHQIDAYFATLTASQRHAVQPFIAWLARSGLCSAAPVRTELQRRTASPTSLRLMCERILNSAYPLHVRVAGAFAIGCCMTYAAIAHLTVGDIVEEDGAVIVGHPFRRPFPLPPPLVSIVLDLKRQRDQYLFPRRWLSGTHVGAVTIGKWMRGFLTADLYALHTAMLLALIEIVPTSAIPHVLPVTPKTVTRVARLRTGAPWRNYMRRLYTEIDS